MRHAAHPAPFKPAQPRIETSQLEQFVYRLEEIASRIQGSSRPDLEALIHDMRRAIR